MHDGTGATTAQQWDRAGWADHLPAAPTADINGTDIGSAATSRGRGGPGVARLLGAIYPPVACDRVARARWGILAPAIPLKLYRRPHESWHTVDLPADLAAQVGMAASTVDLTDPTLRARLLPAWLAVGPADLLADTVSWEQLVTEWPLLDVQEAVREAWEDVYPGLTDDIGQHPDQGLADASWRPSR